MVNKYKGFRMQKIIEYYQKYLNFSQKRPLIPLGLAITLACLCIIPIKNIKLDSQLDKLLPKNTPTIQALNETNKRFGSADLFTISIQHEDPVEIVKIQKEIKAHIEKEWDDALYVQMQRKNDFFEKNALLYLPTEELEKIITNLTDVQLELSKKTSLVVDLEENKSKEKRVWFDKDLPKKLGLPREAASAFNNFFTSKEENKVEVEGQEQVKEWNPRLNIPEEYHSYLIGEHPDGTMNGVVQASLKYSSSNTDYVKDIRERTQRILDPIRKRYGDKIDVGIEGSYNALEDVENLANNGLVATVISIVVIIFLVIFLFRSVGSLIVILFQVTMSSIYTVGVTGLTYGRLNLYTVFVIAILLGIGIDYAIHYMGHAQLSLKKDRNWNGIFIHTFTLLFKPIVLAAVTTIASLLTLLAARFVGFYEFGVIASIGVLFSLVNAFLLIPVVIFALEKLEKIPILNLFRIPPKKEKMLKVGLIQRFLAPLSLALIIVSLGGAFFINKTEFEHDFSNLRDKTPKKKASNRHVSVALTSNRASSQPIVSLTSNVKTMELLHDTLLHRLTVDKDPILRSFLTMYTFVPPLDKQEDRFELIEEIGDLVSTRVFKRSKGEDSAMIVHLKDMTDIEVFDINDIPSWASRLLLERDGSVGNLGFIYGSFRSSDAKAAAEFQNKYGSFKLNGEKIKLFSSSFIYAEIIRLVKEDSLKMSWLILLIIILTLALTLRKVKLVLIVTIVFVVSILLIVGSMGLFNVKLGPFNLIVIPTLLGVSVDSVIHLLVSYQHYGKDNLDKVFGITGKLVFASVVTTLAGYCGMLFTTHQGIKTIGMLALLGFILCLLTTVILTPWLCQKLKVKSV